MAPPGESFRNTFFFLRMVQSFYRRYLQNTTNNVTGAQEDHDISRYAAYSVNQAVKVDKYPIPNINDLFTKLTGGVMYTKLDLSHAYQQVVLDEESRKLTTINTS